MSGIATNRVGVRELRIGLLGCGMVGQAVVRALEASSGRLAEAGVGGKCVVALVRDPDRPRATSGVALTSDLETWHQHGVDVVVEALGGVEPARTLIARVLSSGIPVVTANKSLVAAHGLELQRLAAQRGTALYFEASVLAGVPCVNTLARRPLASGRGHWAGIVNGTSHFVSSQMAHGRGFEDALTEAVARGYAEPASDADISGRDAAEKLTILLHLAGHGDVTVDDFPRRGIGDLEPWHFALAGRLAGVLKPVVMADTAAGGGAWVGPAFVGQSHPFAQITGVTNILSVGRGEATVTFSGPGAGPDVTALTVLDDVVEAASGRAPCSLPSPEASVPVARHLRTPKAGAWFLAIDRVTSSAGELAEFLSGNHLPALALACEDQRFGVLTAPARHSTLRAAVEAIAASGVRATWWPVLEVPRG